MQNPNRLPPLPPGFVLDTPNSATAILPRTPAPQTPAQAEKDRIDVQNARLTGAKTQMEIDEKNPGKKEQKNAISLLTAAGVDLQKGVDPIADLIKGSTSGYVEYGAAELKGAVTGDATPGMEKIAKLQTLVSDMTLQLTGGSLDNQISNADREFIMQRVGNLGDARRPADERLAAWEQVKQRMANLTGVKYSPTEKYGMGFFDEKPQEPVNPLNPEQQAAYDAFTKANPNADETQIANFFGAMGFNPKNAGDVAAAAKAGRGFRPAADAEFTPPDISDVRGKGGAGESADAVARGFGNVVPFMDEVAAAGNTIFGDGTYRENLNRERAIDQYDWENNTPEAIAGTILGGMAIPTKAPKVYHAARGEALAAGATEKAAHAAGKSAFVKQMAKEGGTYGAAYGAGSEGDLSDRAGNAVVGGLTGATVAAVGGKVLGPRQPKPTPDGPAPLDVARSLQDEGIPGAVPLADPSKRGNMAYLETTRGGHNVVRDSLEQTRVGIADKVAGLKGAGENKTPGGMGDRIQEAGKKAIDTQKGRATRLYDRAANAGGDTAIEPKEALATLDRHIADLERNPNTNKGVLSYLKTVRKDFVGQKAAASAAGAKAFEATPQPRGPLRDNFPTDLGKYADRLWRETSLERSEHLMPNGGSTNLVETSGELYFADVPDLALGQGSNRGVLLEFDAKGLRGKPDFSKPASRVAWDGGSGSEYVARHNNASAYKERLRAVRISKDVQSSPAIQSRMRRVFNGLERSGWTKSETDKFVQFERPSGPSSQTGMGGKTVADIRDIRTGLSGEINRRNLGKSNAERIMGEVLEAARNDIARDLGKANPDALKLYQQGDDMWRQMSTERKQVLERIVGPADNPKSGEQVMSQVRNMMGNKGDMNRFQRVMNMLDPEDRDDFAATLIEGIGQKSPEEPFSPAAFLANTKDMQADALKTVFGEKGARSIMNLRVASRAFTDTVGSLNNSRSGFVANFKDIVASVSNLRSAGGGAVGFMVGGMPGAIAGAVAGEAIQRGVNHLSAKTLMNTDVSQWVRAVSKAKTEKESRGLIAKLGTLASRNPAISQELTGLRQFLVKAANDNLTPRLAAEKGDEQNNR